MNSVDFADFALADLVEFVANFVDFADFEVVVNNSFAIADSDH